MWKVTSAIGGIQPGGNLNTKSQPHHHLHSPIHIPIPLALSPPLHSLAMNLASSRLLLPRSLRHSSLLSYYSCSSSRRLLSTTPVAAPDGYTASNDEVARLATNPLKPLTLRDLVRFGRPPLSPQALLASARFTREFLPIRLCRRIVALRNLPFIIVSNPHVSSIYENYQQSLRIVQSFPVSHPNTLAEEVAFTEMLIEIVKTHANTIPTLARGFLECRRYISPAEATKFLDHHLRARIGTRLMAEQHIALHLASTTSSVTNNSPIDYDGGSDTYIGTIDTALQPAHIIESCASFVGDICELRYGVRPQLRIDGDPEVRFPYIPVHLEYIITELLKNAFRATVEAGSTVPIIVTIAAAPESAGITIRIRDQGGGIAPEDIGQIWSYSFSTFDQERSVAGGGSGEARDPSGDDALGRFNEVVGAAEGSSIAGLGYGLPLSRAYAEYFGGSLKVQSAFGWGTDVYLKLKGVGIGDFGGPGMEGLSGHHDDV